MLVLDYCHRDRLPQTEEGKVGATRDRHLTLPPYLPIAERGRERRREPQGMRVGIWEGPPVELNRVLSEV